MSDRPIIFSGPMVLALLKGRKTQTRRVVRDAPPGDDGWWHCDMRAGRPWFVATPGAPSMPVRLLYAPGDRLWVREGITRFDKGTCDQHVWYRAGGNFLCADGEHAYQAAFPSLTGEEEWPFEEGPGGGAPYNCSSIHMPRWASRLTLLVTDVRVQRLCDISQGDAIDEGVLHDAPQVQGPVGSSGRPPLGPSPRSKFAELWNRLHGAGAWDRNPWVAALTFTVGMANIDTCAAPARELA